jgi:hypothetical protein
MTKTRTSDKVAAESRQSALPITGIVGRFLSIQIFKQRILSRTHLGLDATTMSPEISLEL